MIAALTTVRRYWWAPIILGLTVALLLTRATLVRVRTEYRVEAAQREKATAIALAANAERARVAADDYAARSASLQPIIVRSHDETIRYAASPAGRAVCGDAGRVRAIDTLDAELFTPAGSSTGAVPTDTSPTPAGR